MSRSPCSNVRYSLPAPLCSHLDAPIAGSARPSSAYTALWRDRCSPGKRACVIRVAEHDAPTRASPPSPVSPVPPDATHVVPRRFSASRARPTTYPRASPHRVVGRSGGFAAWPLSGDPAIFASYRLAPLRPRRRPDAPSIMSASAGFRDAKSDRASAVAYTSSATSSRGFPFHTGSSAKRCRSELDVQPAAVLICGSASACSESPWPASRGSRTDRGPRKCGS